MSDDSVLLFLFYCLMVLFKVRLSLVALIFLALVAISCGKEDHPAPSPAPPVPTIPTDWTQISTREFTCRIKYSCECNDEIQAKVLAAPSTVDAKTQPGAGRWIYFRKSDLPGARFDIGQTLSLRILEYHRVVNYHALDLEHEDPEEFLCRVAPFMH